ncbi:hypothetical protein OH768_32220 [Streptomyces sp. NBC_01622]|uniref:hypothetical protein n=1 Tax=Streptomyces sp. NBC_01622 TaxID=2975903 RepID=UPI003866A8AD|nr:hypothetical protein OH768_32220 [Streptomyces sp. NBC_01622]
MTDWLILAGCFVIAVTAWLLDDKVRGAAADRRLEAFVAEDRNGAVVEPHVVERLGPPALGVLNGQDQWAVKQGVVARLVAEGALRRTSPDRSGQKRWMSGGRLPEDADDFERELWTEALPPHVRNPAYSPGQSEGEYLWALRAPNAWRHLEAAEARLLGEGCARRPFETVPGQPRLRGWWSTIAAAAAVPAVTLLVLDHAWIRTVPAFGIGAVALKSAFPDGPAMPRRSRSSAPRCSTASTTGSWPTGPRRHRSSPTAPGSDCPGRGRQAQSCP